MANSAADNLAFVGQIVTPAGVRRRVQRLWRAWQSLVEARPAAASEANEYAAWAKNVLASWTDQFFATGTLDELDRWQDRYRIAWTEAGQPKTAPDPSGIDKTDAVNPWLVLGFLVIGYLIFREIKR